VLLFTCLIVLFSFLFTHSLLAASGPGWTASNLNAAFDPIKDEFSGIQGYQQWSYLDSNYAQLTYDEHKGVWWSTTDYYVALIPRGGLPGNLDAVRRWTAPAAGRVPSSSVARNAKHRIALDDLLGALEHEFHAAEVSEGGPSLLDV
jgi:hypothetical protein